MRRSVLIAAIVALGIAVNHGAQAQSGGTVESSTSKVPGAVQTITVLTVHAKVAAVDRANRLVTLEGPQGRKLNLIVQNPYNLDAAKVGEPVITRFYEVVTIRKKKPDEAVPSASLKEGISSAKPGEMPGGVARRQAALLVSVAAIDEANGTVTVKAPDGTVERVKARDPANLKQLKVGDELVVTVEQAIAISLDNARPGTGAGSYMRYCADCHGYDGKGNGPKSAILTQKPTDLTQLAKGNNGTFPTARLTSILNGDEAIPAHGSAQKPVWGHVFGAAEHAAGGNPEQTVARERVQLIVKYLNGIQEK